MNNNVLASIVLSTYNGAFFLTELLNSLIRQSYSNIEILVFDDCSSDNTIELIESFIKENNAENIINIYKNENNKGFIHNFIDGAYKTKGKYIFFCDQDDVWEKNKIEIMINYMEKKNALAMCCKNDSIDQNGKKILNIIKWLSYIHSVKKVKKLTISKKLKYSFCSGLCLAFNRSILDELRIISYENDLPHDLPVGDIAAINARYYMINKILVHRRIHGCNASNPSTTIKSSLNSLKYQIHSRELKLTEFETIKKIYYSNLKSSERKNLDKAIDISKEIIWALKNRDKNKLLKLFFKRCNMMRKLNLIRDYLTLVRVSAK